MSCRQQHGGANITEKSLKGIRSSNGLTILRRMLKHVWPKDRPDLKRRVVAAVVLLVGAKVPVHLFIKSFQTQNRNVSSLCFMYVQQEISKRNFYCW